MIPHYGIVNLMNNRRRTPFPRGNLLVCKWRTLLLDSRVLRDE
jgi:hypothetical protein